MDLSVRTEGDAKVIRITGRLDTTAAAGFEVQCDRVASTCRSKRILDMDGLDYISSEPLSANRALQSQFRLTQGATDHVQRERGCS